MNHETAQVVEWVNAICAAYQVGGCAAAQDLLDQLGRDHKFDILGMEFAATLDGVDTAVVQGLVYEIRRWRTSGRYARQEAKRQNFGKLYGSQPNIQQVPRK